VRASRGRCAASPDRPVRGHQISATIAASARRWRQAQEPTGVSDLTAIADRDYFKGEEILACEATGVTPLLPMPLTSTAEADGRFGKQGFVYDAGEDVYRCPADEKMTWRYWSVEAGRKLHNCWTTKCAACTKERRIKRWEHEAGAAGTRAQGHARPTPDRGTSIRNHQGVHGRDPLPPAHP
jgi:hypothetical protein